MREIIIDGSAMNTGENMLYHGAGYQLAADAKRINPRLTLDMLWWSEPK